MIQTEIALRSLKSEVCPACNGAKKFKQSVCDKCWKKLSRVAQANLYKPMRNGYEEALDDALVALGATELHLSETDTH